MDLIEAHIRQNAVRAFASSGRYRVTVAGHQFMAYAAESQSQKVVGLEVFSSLASNEGMYFPFDPPEHATFHMGAVRFPIDILFLMPDSAVGKIVHSVYPGDKDRFSQANTAAVLELPGGTCKKLGINVGSPYHATMRVTGQRFEPNTDPAGFYKKRFPPFDSWFLASTPAAQGYKGLQVLWDKDKLKPSKAKHKCVAISSGDWIKAMQEDIPQEVMERFEEVV